MSDYLSVADVAEVLHSHLGEGWSGSDAVLYLQAGDSEHVEVCGNFALTSTADKSLFRHSISRNRIREELATFIDGLEISRAYVANQRIFRLALEQLAPLLPGGVQRFVRRGDCQAGSNFGTSDEQDHCKTALEHHPSDDHTVVIVPVLGTDLLFGLCSFLWDPAMFFSSPVKFCRPLSEFGELVVPTLVAQKGLRRILVMDVELEHRLRSHPSMRHYMSLFVGIEPPEDDIAADRAAIRELLSSRPDYMGGLHLRKGEHGLFGGWLRRVRQAHRRSAGESHVQQSGTRRPQSDAVRAFYSVLERNDDPYLRGAIADCQRLELQLEGDFLLFAQSAHAVAAAKLGLWDEMPPINELLQRCGEQHPCLQALAEWGTRRRMQTGSPNGWFALLARYDPDTLVKMAKSEVYGAMRAGLEAEAPDMLQAVLPLKTAEENERDGDAARKLYQHLQSDDRNPAAFFKIVDEHELVADAIMQDVLQRSRGLWGESVDQVLWETVLMFRMDRYEEGLKLAERWLILSDTDANAHFWRGQCLRLLERWQEAAEEYHAATELDAEDSRAWRERGRCFWNLSRYEEAEVCAQEACNIRRTPSSLFVLGGILFDQEKYRELIALVGDTDVDTLNESSLARRLLLASVRTEEPARTRERISKIAPTLEASVLAQFVQEAADFYIEASREPEGVELLTPWLQDSEEFAEAAALVACCMGALKRVDDALALCARFAAFMPACERLAVEYASLLKRDRDAARQFVEESLINHPRSLYLLNLAGELAEVRCQGSGAALFSRVLEAVTPTETDRHDGSYDLLHRAIAEYNLGDVAAARSSILRTREVAPDMIFASLFQAVVCLASGDAEATAKAYGDARRLLAAKPDWVRKSETEEHVYALELYARRGLLDTTSWNDDVRKELGIEAL
jgi:tetratricopeptide (TPR) repeat protein